MPATQVATPAAGSRHRHAERYLPRERLCSRGLSSRALTFAVGAADGDVWGGLGAGVRLAVLAWRVVPVFHVMRAHVLRLMFAYPCSGKMA